MSESIDISYERWRSMAVQMGWHIPPKDSPISVGDWRKSWVRYWMQMDDYERKIASSPARPVIPHRT